MFQNIPKVKVSIVAVSRACFPESLSVNRRGALVEAYRAKYDAADIYECPVCIVESEIHMQQALEDIKKAGCNALAVHPWAILGRKYLRRFWQSILKARKCLLQQPRNRQTA